MSKRSAAAYRAKHPWHSLYHNAKCRCVNPKSRDYKFYGALGIKFLISQHEVEYLFYFCGGPWMKSPTLDRIDSSKDYVYSNCRVIEKHINERLPHDAKLAAEWTD